jgi:hypothetical protein
MIQITFTHSIIPNGPATDLSIIEDVSRDIYDTIYTRLKNFVEQNVILNCCIITYNENNQLIASHFASTSENAQLFIDAYADAVAFWEPYGIEFKISQKEIDFATIDTATTIELLDENGTLYGLSY